MVISQKKQTNNYKEKLVILQSIGIIVIKSKETRMITYTCRYSSGHLSTIFLAINFANIVILCNLLIIIY